MRARTHRRSRRGITLIEMMIAMAIGLFLTAAAVLFVQHETRLMGISTDRLEMIQGARGSLDLLADDLRKAGQGVGYDEAGTFQGLLLGQFQAGGLTWNPNGAPAVNPQPLPPGPGAFRNVSLAMSDNRIPVNTLWTSRSVDIGMQFADGSYATIADMRGGTVQFCQVDDDNDGFADPVGDHFDSPEVVVFREAAFISASVFQINGYVTGPCTYGDCKFDCVLANVAPVVPLGSDPIFNSGPGSNSVSYIGGEIQGGYRKVVWFVTSRDPANVLGHDATFGRLQRAEFINNVTCGAADVNCGGTAAMGVESLQMQVWQFVANPPPGVWVNVGQGPITNPTPAARPPRMRVDIEMVVRADSMDERPHPQIPLRLRANTCVPGPPCNPAAPLLLDYTERRVYRTSVEIKNAGFMALR